jgi:hypothetical protein
MKTIKTFMETNSPEPMLCVPPQRGRAVVALLLPILAICVLIYQLLIRGYSIPDYFWLITSGQLNWARQGIMWVALTFWIVRYWPAAWQAIRSDFLIVQTDRQIRLASGAILSLDDIISVESKGDLLFKGMLFQHKNGNLAKQSLLFGGANSREVINRLRDYLKQQQNVEEIF